MAARKADESPVYQLKVTLRGIRPPIWRRVQVRGSTTLPRLHRILQILMDWQDYHLHQFIAREDYYGVPVPGWDLDILDERRVRLDQLVSAVKDRFVYGYDFGDSWEHEIVVEAILPPEPGARYPICLAGGRARPPEDVGGVWGYAGFLEAIGDADHPEHAELLEWAGGSFDAEHFDLAAVNRRLSRLR